MTIYNKEFCFVYVSVFKRKKKSIDKITSWESPRGVIVCNLNKGVKKPCGICI